MSLAQAVFVIVALVLVVQARGAMMPPTDATVLWSDLEFAVAAKRPDFGREWAAGLEPATLGLRVRPEPLRRAVLG